MNPTHTSTQPHVTDRDGLIRLHLPLAYRLAACYRGFGESYANLVQTAGVGLVRAAERFDPGCGSSFRAFATPTITAELSRSLDGREPEAGCGQSRRRLADGRTRQINGAQRRISCALGRGSRVQGLAELLGLDADVVADALLSAAGLEAVTLNLPGRRQRGGSHGESSTPRAA